MSSSNGLVEIQVNYPLEKGRLVLRTDLDWERDWEATQASPQCHCFQVPCQRPYLYFKPVVVDDGQLQWCKGDNYLALAAEREPRQVHPFFFDEDRCSVCELREFESAKLGRKCQYRLFYPPGYHENPTARYPVLYMHDGQNLFFPEEAAYGSHWKVEETLSLLSAMNAIAKVLAVGVYPAQRNLEYTLPGYQDYGAFIAEELKPFIDTHYRTKPGPSSTAAMGSSLGGVVSFYMAWQWPHVFGQAACLSSTFGYRDDLQQRVASEPRRPLKIYLDSGWPRDNYEVTRNMRSLLLQSGYREGCDLLYLAFPEAAHNESAWAMRSHIPYQFFFDRCHLS